MSAVQSRAQPAHLLLLQSGLTVGARQHLALADCRDAVVMWRLALILGWFDIRLRYRGSLLGPFWLTLSTAVMVAALGILYSKLFRMELHDYLPYLALSLVLWGFLSTLVSDACGCFTGAEGMIRSMRMPHSLHAVRVVVRNLLILAHNVVVIIAVYAWFDVWPGSVFLLALPALLLWTVDGLAVCLLLGPVCARFRDIPPIVASVMQIAFFVSPIIWKPDLLQGKAGALMLLLNPFYTLLEIVRAPLLGAVPSGPIWASALGYSLALWVGAWLLFARVRGRLAFWV
ncbi:MAG: ABC transporter permease [Acetobacteraceae bacterium]|nr:ABC transporter permease [Acetobacteraceae bacterium]